MRGRVRSDESHADGSLGDAGPAGAGRRLGKNPGRNPGRRRARTGGGRREPGRNRDRRGRPLLTAAAILVLFLAGLGVGRMVGPGTPGDSVAGGTDGAADELAGAIGDAESGDAGVLLAAEYPEYLRSVAGLRALREGGPSSEEIATDPALAAERLTRLDALIEASREALKSAPADAALNDFLFDVVDERASVAGQLDQTIRQASMEY